MRAAGNKVIYVAGFVTREEVFYCHRGRHPVLMRLRTGVTNEGKITGMSLQTLLDGGA